jgi:hypothetical protein
MGIYALHFVYTSVVLLSIMSSYSIYAGQGIVSSPTGITIRLQDISTIVQKAIDKDLSITKDERTNASITISGDTIVAYWKIVLPSKQSPTPTLSKTIFKNLNVSASKDNRHQPQPKVTFRYEGCARGIHLGELSLTLVNRNPLNTVLQCIESGLIELRYSQPFTIVPLKPQQRPSVFAYNVVNPEYSIENTTIKNDKSISLQADRFSGFPQLPDWYDPKLEYLKVETTKDGIAFVTGEQIRNTVPGFMGKQHSGIHLLHRGLSVPLLIISSDDKLTTDDTLLFLGSRNRGDTSWFNTYSPTESFYLTLDNKKTPKRFSLSTPQSGLEILRRVEVLRHFEKDVDYNLSASGYPIEWEMNTETSPGELWFWERFGRYIGSKSIIPIKRSFVYSPAMDDNLTIKTEYYSTNFDVSLTPDRRHQIFVNGVLSNDTTIDDIMRRSAKIQVPTASVLSGKNTFVISDTSLYPQSQYSTDIVNVFDFFEVQGTEQPLAFNGQYEFTANKANKSVCKVSGLTQSRVIALDTLENTAFIRNGVAGSTIRASYSKDGLVSIMINDISVLDSSLVGLHIACQQPDGVIRKLSQSSSYTTARELIQSLPNGSICVMAFPKSQELVNEFNSIFNEQGLSAISQASNRTIITLAFVKGNPTQSVWQGSESQITRLADFIPHSEGKSYQVSLELERGNSLVRVADFSMNAIEKANVSQQPQSDLRNVSNGADYIVIYHPKFVTQAKRLAEYRKRDVKRTMIVPVDDIYKEFGAGIKSPHSIRNFTRYAFRNWVKPAPMYIAIMGDASWDPRMIPPQSIMIDYVPTYGFPVSDYWYTLMDDDSLPDMTIGRLSVSDTLEAKAMVDKIIEYDQTPPQPWAKRYLFISGGDATTNEAKNFYKQLELNYVEFIAEGSGICGDTITASNYLGPQVAPVIIVNSINEGVVWTNFVGHGSPTLTDIRGWEPSVLNNKGRYTILSTYSCRSGAFAEREAVSINEDYVRKQDRAMVAALGTTGWGIVHVDLQINKSIFEMLARTPVRRLGDIILAIKNTSLTGRSIPATFNAIMQFSLLGDPLTKILLDTMIHPYCIDADTKVRGKNNEEFITEDMPSAKAQFRIHNAGVNFNRFFQVVVKHLYNGKTDSISIGVNGLCKYHDLIIDSLKTLNESGEHIITVEVDPNNFLGFDPKEEWKYSTSFTVFAPSLLPVNPLNDWNIQASKPKVRFINSFAKRGKFTYEGKLFSVTRNRILDSVQLGNLDNMTIATTHCDWHTNVELDEDEDVEIRYRAFFVDSGAYTPWTILRCRANKTIENEIVIKEKYASDFIGYESTFRKITNDSSEIRFILNSNINAIAEGASSGDARRDSTYINPITGDTTFSDSWMQLTAGPFKYGSRGDIRGFNFLEVKRNDSTKTRSYWYDTGVFQPDSTRYQLRRNALKTLDSLAVNTNSYIVFAICQAYQFPDYTAGKWKDVSPSNDTLRRWFARNGSLIPSDSLYMPWSYTYIGQCNFGKTKLLDERRIWVDTSISTAKLTIQHDTGSITTKVYGPAGKWKSVKFSGLLDTSICESAMYSVYGRTSLFGNDVLLFQVQDTLQNIDLSTKIDARTYPYVKIKLYVKRKHYETDPYLSSVELRYLPIPEYAVDPEQTSVAVNNLLKGDSTVFNSAIIQLNERTQVDTVYVRTSLQASGSITSPVYTPRAFPTSMFEQYRVTDIISTRDLTNKYVIGLEYNPERKSLDMYPFNNIESTSFNVRNDSIKPVIRVYLDGEEMREGMFAPRKALITAILDDNAKPLYVDSIYLRSRLNNLFVNSQRYPDYQYSNAPSAWSNPLTNPTTRAMITYTAELESGQNNFQFIGVDFFGNRDTIRRQVNASNITDVKGISIAPNPVLSSAIITYTYRGDVQNTDVYFDIVDMNGIIYRRLSHSARIGANSLVWDCRDAKGETIPSGVYGVRMYIKGFDMNDIQHTLFVKLPD